MQAKAAMPDLQGLRVLVVEDTALVAEVILEALEQCGCEVVGPAADLTGGLALAQREALDGALLDINLAGECSFPIAEALAARRIGFVFLTGYGDAGIPEAWQQVPLLQKPFTLTTLTRLVAAQFGKQA